MEKTISNLESNKSSVVSIIKNLQKEYERKKAELMQIKTELPLLFNQVAQLKKSDQVLRQKLAMASTDFSNTGHQKMKQLFDEASAVHAQLLEAELAETALIKRRDSLELDLKLSKLHIEQAEHMAEQLMLSLSYLQVGMEQLHTPVEEGLAQSSCSHYLSFFKCMENEKLRIARDLHDGPTQNIVSVQMRIDFCKTVLMKDLEKGLHILSQLKNDLSTALTEIRDILFNLNPAPLEKMGLKDAIDTLLYNTLDVQTMRITFDFNLDTHFLSPALQSTIYRILQELINNIKKHAQATHITLRFTQDKYFIYIHLEDDGIGFSVPDNFENFRFSNKSYGLLGIVTRIKELDGKLKVSSSPHTGTLFKIQLPNLYL